MWNQFPSYKYSIEKRAFFPFSWKYLSGTNVKSEIMFSPQSSFPENEFQVTKFDELCFLYFMARANGGKILQFLKGPFKRWRWLYRPRSSLGVKPIASSAGWTLTAYMDLIKLPTSSALPTSLILMIYAFCMKPLWF